LGRDASEVAGIGPIGVVLEPLHQDAVRRVIIDFSVADATLAYIRQPLPYKAIVVGTTGFTLSQLKPLLSQNMP
jgi:dihydrodipicolinate reductase